jgi:uncharacterized protein YndB with AHSA1/START domain
MASSRFVYVTYIRTTPEKLWQALTDPEFTRQCWSGTHQESDWKQGGAWKIVIPDGRVADAGEILEIVPNKKLVLKWQNQFIPEMKAEGFSRATYELEPKGDMVKFTVIHEMDTPDSKFIGAVSNGWPMILSSVKSLLETGESLVATREWPKGK